VTYECDDILFEEGSPRTFLVIIITGAVAVEKGQNGRPVRLVTLGAGQSVGEGSAPRRHAARDERARRAEERRLLAQFGAGRRDGEGVPDVVRGARRTRGTLHLAAIGRDGCHTRRTRPHARLRRRTDAQRARFAWQPRRPADALYGIQTLRAMENFPITGTPLREFPELIEALAAVKEAAALANVESGLLDKEHGDLIVRAAQELRAGRHHEHFVVDMIQGGAGTSTNMNANEVIANRALELLGKDRGDYTQVHPNNHVNLSQSTNDVYPTAVKIALHRAIEGLRTAMSELATAFLTKGEEFNPFIKMGRTQLQDAVPMTLGQEFTAFGHTIIEDVDRLGEAQALIREINMGATAIGTGINAPTGYAAIVCRELSRITGLALITAPDLVEATADTGAFVQLSGVLKRCAVKLSKICNDLRLLSSGPRAGFGEINLPAMQPGSSIMPGKVNPVIPEVVNQVCFDIIGGDVTVTIAAEAGQLQLNVFEPVIAYRLLRSIDTLKNGCVVLRERCVNGITANPSRMRKFVEESIGIVTALVPVIGYEHATSVAKEALDTDRGVYEIVMARGLLTREQLDRVLDPDAMTGRK
jgi:aspartate ammonia-lyase